MVRDHGRGCLGCGGRPDRGSTEAGIASEVAGRLEPTASGSRAHQADMGLAAAGQPRCGSAVVRGVRGDGPEEQG